MTDRVLVLVHRAALVLLFALLQLLGGILFCCRRCLCFRCLDGGLLLLDRGLGLLGGVEIIFVVDIHVAGSGSM